MYSEDSKKVMLRRWSKHFYIFINSDLPDRVVRVLKSELSYYVHNHERTDAFKKGVWDGQESLFYTTKKGVNYFPAGLLPQVASVFKAYNIDYVYEGLDITKHLSNYPDLGLNWYGPKLYDYQVKCVSDAILRGGGVINLPTGGGKTLIALKLMQLYDKPTLIIVHRRELMRQWIKEIKKNLHYKAAKYGGGEKDRFEYITVGLMQSLIKYKGGFDFPVLINDETHHTPSDTLYSISMNCNAAVRFGLSATPRREQGDELKIWAAMGTIASDTKPTDLIKAGYLARPKFVFLRPPAVNISRKAKWHDLYMDGIQMNQERNAMIIDAANEMLDDGLLTYIHVERIDHGEYLADHIPGASFVCGATPKKMRDNLIDTFASGQRRCLVSTLLGEGVNIPAMEGIILAGGLKTTVGVIQKLGRALRIKPGKDEAIVVDFVDRGPILGRHWEKRYDAYREYYGEYVPDFAIGKGKQTVKKSDVLPGTTSGEVH